MPPGKPQFQSTRRKAPGSAPLPPEGAWLPGRQASRCNVPFCMWWRLMFMLALTESVPTAWCRSRLGGRIPARVEGPPRGGRGVFTTSPTRDSVCPQCARTDPTLARSRWHAAMFLSDSASTEGASKKWHGGPLHARGRPILKPVGVEAPPWRRRAETLATRAPSACDTAARRGAHAQEQHFQRQRGRVTQ